MNSHSVWGPLRERGRVSGQGPRASQCWSQPPCLPGWKDVAPESLVCVCRVCRVLTQFTVVFWPVATA